MSTQPISINLSDVLSCLQNGIAVKVVYKYPGGDKYADQGGETLLEYYFQRDINERVYYYEKKDEKSYKCWNWIESFSHVYVPLYGGRVYFNDVFGIHGKVLNLERFKYFLNNALKAYAWPYHECMYYPALSRSIRSAMQRNANSVASGLTINHGGRVEVDEEEIDDDVNAISISYNEVLDEFSIRKGD